MARGLIYNKNKIYKFQLGGRTFSGRLTQHFKNLFGIGDTYSPPAVTPPDDSVYVPDTYGGASISSESAGAIPGVSPEERDLYYNHPFSKQGLQAAEAGVYTTPEFKADATIDMPVSVEEAIAEANNQDDRNKEADKIGRIQQKLIEYGFLSGDGDEKADKILGPKTIAAMAKVAAIQKQFGIEDDGIIGPETLREIGKEKLKNISLSLNAGKSTTIDDGDEVAQMYASVDRAAAARGISTEDAMKASMGITPETDAMEAIVKMKEGNLPYQIHKKGGLFYR